jgi:endo-1,4-beta-xylanase
VTTEQGRRKRRLAIVVPSVIGLAVAAIAAIVVNAPASSAATTLGAAAAAKGRVFGAAVANNHLSEAPYATTFDTEFSGLTPENEMKWDATEPSRGGFSFAAADNLVSHAQGRNDKIRGHTLVWHSQLPGWVSGITSGADLLTAMRNHIAGVAGHFQGKIQYWDVVNEAFDNGSRRNSIFQQLIGNSYIEEAFKAARTADPAAKLCYNDFSTDGVNAKSSAILAMVQDFKARNIPIDCVGFQAHLVIGQVPGDFQANLQRFADAGVDVNITELDVRMPTPASDANLQTQANDYRKVVQACLAVSRCTSITVWGVTDKFSWVPSTFSGQGSALLFDDNYAKKASYTSTLDALGGTAATTPPASTPPATTPPVTTPPATTPPATGPAGSCRVTYAMSAWNTGFTTNITIANTGSTAVNGWSLVFTLPAGQVITSGWNATYTPSSGQVTARNMSYNATIAPGASTGLGFQATHTGNTGRPASFTLNGTACSVA